MNIPLIASSLSIALTFPTYYVYIRSMLAGKTKPHTFSWLIWALVTGIAGSAQLFGGGGLGAWPTLLTAIPCILVFVLSFKYGYKEITRSDYISLFGGLLTIALWLATSNPLWASIFSSLIEVFAVIPTYRKTWKEPWQEKLLAYLIFIIKWSLSILALKTFSLTTLLYPAVCISTDLALIGMALWRRTVVKAQPLS